MRGISTTTLIGVAKIIVMLGLLGAWVAKALTWQEAVTAILFAQATLSGIGFIRTQDAGSTEWVAYCDNCGVETDDDNEDGECEPVEDDESTPAPILPPYEG